MTADPTGPLKGPIFIMGFPRSGTSGLASGLSKLPGFADHGPEGHFIYLLDTPILAIRDDNLNPNSIVRAPGPKAAFLSAIAKGVDEAYRTASGAESLMWIDKTPDVAQVRAIPAIRALFPDAWFFYIYRDAASAVRSNVATWPDQLEGKEVSVAQRWRQCQSEWREKSQTIPDNRKLEIFQPDLRKNPEKVVADIAALMGLDADAAAPLLQFWTKNRQVNRPNVGEAAAAYDAVALDDLTTEKVNAICSDEIAHWPRLEEMAAVAEAKSKSRLSRIRAALIGATGAAARVTTASAAPAPVPTAAAPAQPAAPAPAAKPAVAPKAEAAPVAKGPRAAFVGHAFHNRTQSSNFFLDILAKIYPTVDRYDYDMSVNFDYMGLIENAYTQRIFWQSESILARGRHLCPGRNIVVPMYDAAMQRPQEYWHGFGGDLFISFSAKLHNMLQGAGCDSVLVQYWPEPVGRSWSPAAPLSAFFWERRPGEGYDATHVLKTCQQLGITKLHIHLAPDFDSDKAKRRTALRRYCDTQGINVEIVFSEWYEDKAQLKTAMHSHPVYFAARTHEGIGMSFLEAMAHGQIVIGPNNPTLNEYVANGSNGYLFGQGFGIPSGPQAFRDNLVQMSDRTLACVADGHAQWLRDADRLVDILRTGDAGGRMDAGSDFERAVRIAAGDRAAPRHL
ncbi:MAG: hypothetical protein ACI9U6_000083 [Loktanella salsilacus]|jgi:hypothetical protein|uniref:sulfotransferase n=1 Tax=Loktanella salsilacus TaxID=195913 RepID=UPI0039894D9F